MLWSRALVLSAVAWLSGALAHVAADGELPGPAVLLGLLGGGAVAAAPLLRGPASALRTCLLVVLGQQAVHLALSVTARHAAMAGHHHGPLEDPAMLGTHVLAAVACGWWLARGDRALWAVLALGGRAWSRALTRWALLLAGRPLGVRPGGGTATPADHPRPRPLLQDLGRSVSRRGPPRLPALA